jgi:hypothetical protein
VYVPTACRRLIASLPRDPFHTTYVSNKYCTMHKQRLKPGSPTKQPYIYVLQSPTVNKHSHKLLNVDFCVISSRNRLLRHYGPSNLLRYYGKHRKKPALLKQEYCLISIPQPLPRSRHLIIFIPFNIIIAFNSANIIVIILNDNFIAVRDISLTTKA